MALAKQYSEAVALRFPKGKGTLVKVALRNHKGKPVVDIKGIPLEQMSQLAEALTGRPLPGVIGGQQPQPPVRPSSPTPVRESPAPRS